MDSAHVVEVIKVVGGVVAGAFTLLGGFFAIYRFVLRAMVDRVGKAIDDLADAVRDNTRVITRMVTAGAVAVERDRELRMAIDRTTAEVRSSSDSILCEVSNACLLRNKKGSDATAGNQA